MKHNSRRIHRAGFIVTAELVLITTVLLFGTLIGMVAIRDGLIAELRDTGTAIGRLNQSYGFQGVAEVRRGESERRPAWTVGSRSLDEADQGEDPSAVTVVLTPPEPEAGTIADNPLTGRR